MNQEEIKQMVERLRSEAVSGLSYQRKAADMLESLINKVVYAKMDSDLLDEIGKELDSVKYSGTNADGVRLLKEQLAECQRERDYHVINAKNVYEQTTAMREELAALKAERVEPVAWRNTNEAVNHMKKAERDALHDSAMANANAELTKISAGGCAAFHWAMLIIFASMSDLSKV